MVSLSSPSLRRTARRGAAVLTTTALAAGALAIGAAPVAAAPVADDLASRFTFAVLPDTQFYSRYSPDQFVPRYGSDPFAQQTAWLAENAEALNIPFVAHLGDVVDRAGVQPEWEAADRAMGTLEESGLPYSILPGNHDVLDSGRSDDELDSAAEPFNRWFGQTRAAEQSTYGGTDATGRSQFHIFEAEGQRFMSLALSWNPSDATLAWAQGVLDAHPDVPVILTNHALINVAPDQVSPIETGDSERMWDQLIRGNDQIFMTLNGHFHGATRQVKQNDLGHDVHQILMDYQMAYEGGNGYLGLFEFDLTNDTISLETGSPWVTFKPQETLTAYDQPLLDGANQRFTLDVDFAERFAGFDPDFVAGPADEPSLTQAARDILLDGFEGPDPISTEQPGDQRDFPEVDGTLAHWRFNGVDGVLGASTVVEDVAGDNDLTRAVPEDSGSPTAEWEDVTVENADVHGFSSDGAAACFDATDRRTGRLSYLTTAPDAAINDADLTDGYTIESFVKMDADWTADANQWSKFVTRTGNRSQIPGAVGDRWSINTSPMALGISNLREFQFTSLPGNVERGDRVNWSGEIMVDSWSHVAVVNDAEAGTTTMYVDGAPVLRNTNDAFGMASNPGMPWIIGADYADNAYSSGWHGCVGETRIIDHPTTPDQWLTQRADLTGLTIDEAPAAELTAGEQTLRFAGTGLPGADVHARSSFGELATVVAEDGTWEFERELAVPAGTYDIEIVQSLGSRSGQSATRSFEVVEAEAAELEVAAKAYLRKIGSYHVLSVLTKNDNDVPVSVRIETGLGTKTVRSVQPGQWTAAVFTSRAGSVPAGEAIVEVTGTVGGERVTGETTAPYRASR